MKIRTSIDLLQLIKASRNPLPVGRAKSELIEFIDSFNKLKKNSEERKRILSLIRNLANDIEQFEDDDFRSLLSFFVLTHIDDYDTFLSFEQTKDKIKNIDRQALFLKLLHTINREGLSKLLLNSYLNIKRKYPVFWADIYFDIDICESINTLIEANLKLREIETPLKKWLNLIEKNENHQYKSEVIQKFIKNDLKAVFDKDGKLIKCKTESEFAAIFANKLVPRLTTYEYAS